MKLAQAQQSQVAAQFSKAAQHYDNAAQLQKQVLSAATKYLLSNLDSDSDLIDMGCGTGNLLNHLNELKNYTAIDLAQGMIDKAKNKYETQDKAFTANWLQADIQNTHLMSGTYSHIFSSLAWQWCDLKSVLAESHRLLKPDGELIFTTLLDGTLSELTDAYQSIDDYQHVNQFETEAEFNKTLQTTDWQSIRVQIVTEHTYYPSVYDLLKELKSIGANSIITQTPTTPLTKARLRQLELAYTKRLSATNENINCSISASWQVAYCHLVK